MTPALTAGVARQIDARRGSRLRAVHQDGPLAFRFDLRAPGARTDLVVALGPPFPRCHLADPRAAPSAPTALAAALRARLVGARLRAAAAVPGERALVVRLQRGGVDLDLWVELFGGQANFYVVGPDETVQLTPRGDVAKRRGAAQGQRFEAVVAREAPEPPVEEASVLVIERAAAAAAGRAQDSAQTRLRRFLKRKLAAARKARTQLDAALEGEAAAETFRRRGELLRGAFHLLRPGQTHVRVPDYSRDPPEQLEIEVDPRLAPGEQVAACFRRERRLRRAAEQARTRLGETAAREDALAAALEALAETTDLESLARDLPGDLAAAAQRELAEPPRPRPPRGPQRVRPWHTFLSADGWRVLVGRDARGNDELTLHQAQPGDLFLHVRGATGSHVIVPTPRGKTVPRDTLLDAAELACHFSERRKAERNEVDFTPRRYVRKPRGSPRGLVLLERAKTLSVRRDEARRGRLLASRLGSEGEPAP